MSDAVERLRVKLARSALYPFRPKVLEIPVAGYRKKDGTWVKPHKRRVEIAPTEQLLKAIDKYKKTGDPGDDHEFIMEQYAVDWRRPGWEAKAKMERSLIENRKKRHGKVWPMTKEEQEQVGPLRGYIGNDPRIHKYWPQGFAYAQYEILMERNALEIMEGKSDGQDPNETWVYESSSEDITKTAVELHSIPTHLLEKWVYRGGRMIVGEGRTMADVQGDDGYIAQPGDATEGFKEDRRKSDVGGYYSPKEDLVFIGSRDHGGTLSLVAHEFGHAMDSVTGGSSDQPEFRRMWMQIERHLSPYFSKANKRSGMDAGNHETFAEMFGAICHAQGLVWGDKTDLDIAVEDFCRREVRLWKQGKVEAAKNDKGYAELSDEERAEIAATVRKMMVWIKERVGWDDRP